DYQVNSMEHTDGLNDADEMNLYVPNPLADSPFGPADLEWLYRQQDVDGSSLVSRLAQLAPVSFTNPIDGQRRRRLFALDSWEMNNFVWANDNPGNAFPNNHNFALNANAGFPYLGAAPGLPTPSLAQRDKKINLNYPLPVSNDAEEPIRQKWISDAYELMKSVLPPKAVDTPDELAALSQFLVNVIDFRDPDCTMTHFRNPDVEVVLGTISGGTTPTYQPTYLAPIGATIPAASTAWSTTRSRSTRPWRTRSRARRPPRLTAFSSSWSTPCPRRPSACSPPTILVPASRTLRTSRRSTCPLPITTW